MNTLISVITPVYNAEQYINECLQSVLIQTFSQIEVIVVDDGSQDKSQNICKVIRKADQRIKLVLQEHKGVSAARNVGIKNAHGKYLFFLDSDDIIHPRLLESLYNLAEEKHSIITTGNYYIGTFEQHNWKESILDENDIKKSYTYVENRRVFDSFMCGGPIKGLDSIGGKMILHDAVKWIEFDEYLPNGEDTKFMYHLISNGADMAILDKDWYFYRKHEGNTHTKRSIESCHSMYKCERYICDQEIKKGRISNAAFWEEYFILHHMKEWYKECRKSNDRKFRLYLKKLAKEEQRLEIFRKTSFRAQLEFMLLFNCFPLYYMLRNILQYKKRGCCWL